MRAMRLTWGNLGSAVDTAEKTSGSLVNATLFFAYLFVWSLVMAAYIAMFVVTGVVTSLLVLAWLPCFLWSRILPKDKSRRSGHGPKARLLR